MSCLPSSEFGAEALTPHQQNPLTLEISLWVLVVLEDSFKWQLKDKETVLDTYLYQGNDSFSSPLTNLILLNVPFPDLIVNREWSSQNQVKIK